MNKYCIILFGATGDLAKEKLFPSLFNFTRDSSAELPNIIAIGRRPYDNEEFLRMIRASLEAKTQNNTDQISRFLSLVTYYRMDFQQPDQYCQLSQFLQDIDVKQGETNRLFYLSVPPSEYKGILSNLAECTLATHNSNTWRRLVIEKPYGSDLASSQNLNQHISALFKEEQIYRIDHYLGKETVQNLLAFRFANALYEPVWNAEHIDNIQITVAEEEGIKSRAAYYDQTGAFKDLIQNHVLQLLALLIMDKPAILNFEALSDAKSKILAELSFDPTQTVFGQYQGYKQEVGVPDESVTETYAMTTFYSQSQRWRGVPFYVRTGKKLERRISEISVVFKPSLQLLFTYKDSKPSATILTFRLQPDEGISMQFLIKTPGEQSTVQPVTMEFCYSNMFNSALPDAYERLFSDILQGDKSLSLREDTIEMSWRCIDPITEYKKQAQVLPYVAGSWGPEAADKLLAKNNREWLAHTSQICNGVIINQL